MGQEFRFQYRPGGDQACREDERSDAHVHERSTPSFDFREPPREDFEIDGEDREAGYYHHAAAVGCDERADGDGVEIVINFVLVAAGLLLGFGFAFACSGAFFALVVSVAIF